MLICEPEKFYTAFRESWTDSNCTPPWRYAPPLGPRSLSTPWTRWAEDCMLEIANTQKLHCQNRANTLCPGQEWMKIDHIFVKKDKKGTPPYDSFPLIAVEHENGEFGGSDGNLPPGDKQYASIEWAFWKVLSMRSKLSVLVAYSKQEQGDGKKELQKMIDGWRNTYDNKNPKVLVLMGWHDGAKFTKEENIYSAYCVDEEGQLNEMKDRQ